MRIAQISAISAATFLFGALLLKAALAPAASTQEEIQAILVKQGVIRGATESLGVTQPSYDNAWQQRLRADLGVSGFCQDPVVYTCANDPLKRAQKTLAFVKAFERRHLAREHELKNPDEFSKSIKTRYGVFAPVMDNVATILGWRIQRMPSISTDEKRLLLSGLGKLNEKPMNVPTYTGFLEEVCARGYFPNAAINPDGHFFVCPAFLDLARDPELSPQLYFSLAHEAGHYVREIFKTHAGFDFADSMVACDTTEENKNEAFADLVATELVAEKVSRLPREQAFDFIVGGLAKRCLQLDIEGEGHPSGRKRIQQVGSHPRIREILGCGDPFYAQKRCYLSGF